MSGTWILLVCKNLISYVLFTLGIKEVLNWNSFFVCNFYYILFQFFEVGLNVTAEPSKFLMLQLQFPVPWRRPKVLGLQVTVPIRNKDTKANRK